MKTCACGNKIYTSFSKCTGCYQKKYQDKRKEKMIQQNKKGTLVYQAKPNTTRKESGELKMFLEIWNERPRISEVSGKPLGNVFKVMFMSHCLPKGSYPNYRLRKENIILKTEQEHFDWHNKPKSELLQQHPGWKRIFDLKDQLAQQYMEEFPTIHYQQK